MEWSIAWDSEANEPFQESYVNLIPTSQGGAHVNSFRSGIIDAMREFCEKNNLKVNITPYPHIKK